VLCSVTGNSNNLSGHCRDNCVNFSCGDGITDPGELCDDGLFGTTGAQSIDDIDACPNGPSAKALGLACNMANVCRRLPTHPAGVERLRCLFLQRCGAGQRR